MYRSPVKAEAGAVCFKGPADLKARDPSHSESHTWHNTWDALDVGVPGNSEGIVVAARAGRVAWVFNECDSVAGGGGDTECGESFGNHVVVAHGDFEASFYAHIDRIDVARGDDIDAGAPLGSVGDTGAAGPPHVHFSVHRVSDGFAQRWVGTPGPTIPFDIAVLDERRRVPHHELDCNWEGTGTRLAP